MLLGTVLVSGLISVALFADLAGATYVLQGIYRLSPQGYSFAFGLNSLGFMVFGFAGGRLCERWSEQGTLVVGLAMFFERVTWDGDVAAGWRPHADQRSPVRMTPEVRFGRPAVSGISTEVLWEQVDAGEDVHDVAALFDLTVDAVRWALAYETSVRAA